MTRNYILLSLLILFSLAANAQRSDLSGEKNAQSLYLEGGGPGLVTINYEQRFKGQTGFGFRAGMGGYGAGKSGVFTVPVGINYITGSESQFAEIGAGICPVSISAHNKYFDNTSSTIVAYFNFGYRYQPIKKGWSYRIFLSPLLTSEGLIPFYGGASIGIKF